MKKIKTLAELVESIIKLHKTSEKEKEENLEFVDINKSIEKMLTAKSRDKNKKLENILISV